LRGVVLDQGLVELAGQAGGARTRADEAGAAAGQFRRNLLLQDRFLVFDFLNLRRQCRVLRRGLLHHRQSQASTCSQTEIIAYFKGFAGRTAEQQRSCRLMTNIITDGY